MVYRDIKVYKKNLNPASVAANTTAEQTFTVTGLDASRDVVLNVIKPTNTAGLSVVNARISADDTLAITFGNHTGSGVDAAAEDYLIVVGRCGTDPLVDGDLL